jgi:predicted RNA polymerase sigma factor
MRFMVIVKATALVLALETWPRAGVPENPGARLMTTAKNRAISVVHRRQRLERKHEQLGRDLESKELIEAAIDDDVGDDLLRLVFASCHPILSPAPLEILRADGCAHVLHKGADGWHALRAHP